ncbi:MAG: class I SAM-dependent methyltransferase [Chitinophagaceae bacterium]|jgi:hypothetical protein|nr:class I SAM-dependent methyltransferase [Chitinophagaceae bacterium]
MSKKIKPIKFLKSLFTQTEKTQEFPADFEPWHIDIIQRVKPFTMTSNERLYCLIESVKYIINNNIEGDFVECGVWKGGSMMAAALTLQHLGINNRKLYLYDTYSGMTEPTEADTSYQGEKASDLLKKDVKIKDESVVWAYSSLEMVRKNVLSTGYPENNIVFIEGDVLKTIPNTIPEKVALLRLDTDWYESTRHEMIHLFPLLVKSGVLIIDDYGFWRGSRKAIDEYISEHKPVILLNRIDDTGRIATKI